MELLVVMEVCCCSFRLRMVCCLSSSLIALSYLLVASLSVLLQLLDLSSQLLQEGHQLIPQLVVTGLLPDALMAVDWYEVGSVSWVSDFDSNHFQSTQDQEAAEREFAQQCPDVSILRIQSTLKAVFTLYSIVINHSLDQTVIKKH
ncbi:hypothetical protein ABVT39_014164 [Epinephelus coioides]